MELEVFLFLDCYNSMEQHSCCSIINFFSNVISITCMCWIHIGERESVWILDIFGLMKVHDFYILKLLKIY